MIFKFVYYFLLKMSGLKIFFDTINSKTNDFNTNLFSIPSSGLSGANYDFIINKTDLKHSNINISAFDEINSILKHKTNPAKIDTIEPKYTIDDETVYFVSKYGKETQYKRSKYKKKDFAVKYKNKIYKRRSQNLKNKDKYYYCMFGNLRSVKCKSYIIVSNNGTVLIKQEHNKKCNYIYNSTNVNSLNAKEVVMDLAFKDFPNSFNENICNVLAALIGSPKIAKYIYNITMNLKHSFKDDFMKCIQSWLGVNILKIGSELDIVQPNGTIYISKDDQITSRINVQAMWSAYNQFIIYSHDPLIDKI